MPTFFRACLLSTFVGVCSLLLSTTASADDTSSCGLPESGDCDVENGTPGCSDEVCCLAICEIDLFCCKEVWDDSCAVLAIELCDGGGGCGSPGAGDCHSNNGTPACDDQECCFDVCAADPYCCETAWDQICADAAAFICYDGPAPENDNCADAIDLGTGDSVTAFSTLGATNDGPDLPGECESFGSALMHYDIWYTWTASTNEIVVISTCNDATFDTRLAAWTGECEDLQFYACNDDGLGCAGYTSQLVMEVTSGTTYRIQVAGWSATAVGDGNLTVCEGSACLAGCISECAKTDVVENELCGEDLNGGCNDTNGYPVQEIEVGDTICGSMWAAGGTRDTDWFEFTTEERLRLKLEVSANVGVVLFFLSNECPSPSVQIGAAYNSCPAVHEACLDAGTWRVFVGANGFDGIPCGSGPLNLYTATLTSSPAEVEGNTCAEALDIGSLEGDYEFSTVCTETSGGPLPVECESYGSVEVYNDIYLLWTAPSSGDFTFSTCNQASYDTRLAAYDTCDGVLLACNDDGVGCAGYSSLMPFAGAVEGETYVIRIGAFGNGVTGTGTLSIYTGSNLPDNDECVDAEPISLGQTVVSTIGATTSGPDLPIECEKFSSVAIYNDVWFEYMAGCTGTTTASFCVVADASYDTKMAVYEGGCPDDGQGVVVACNDDTCGLTSEVSFESTCGTTYFIRVGSYSAAAAGTATLDISCPGEPCEGPSCPADFNGDGVVDGIDFGLELVAWGDCPSPCPQDLNNDGVVNGIDIGLFLVEWGPCN